MIVEPKLAATVVLLRKRIQDFECTFKYNDKCEFEVFMAKRNEDNKFFGGYHVFPGGSLDNQDITKKSKEKVIGLDTNILNNLREVYNDPSILWIIAIRELFEEAGILIATNKDGALISINKKNISKLKNYQEDLQKKNITMTKILSNENLYYNTSKIKYFGRLITPAMSLIRFDTQFFLCKLPDKQNINLFSLELTEGLWGSPKQILDLYKKQQIKIIFPQYTTLRRLSRFKTIQEAFNNSKMDFRTNYLIRLK